MFFARAKITSQIISSLTCLACISGACEWLTAPPLDSPAQMADPINDTRRIINLIKRVDEAIALDKWTLAGVIVFAFLLVRHTLLSNFLASPECASPSAPS